MTIPPISRGPICRSAANAGVTLLELLVAVSILGVITALLYGSFAAALEAKTLSDERLNRYSALRSALGRLEDDLRGAFNLGTYPEQRLLFRSPGYADRDTLGREQPLLELAIATARDTVPLINREHLERIRPLGDSARVTYEVERADEPDRNEVRLELVRYEHRPAVAETLDRAHRSVLMGDIASIRLRFFDGSSWLERWDLDVLKTRRTLRPLAVEIEVFVSPEESYVTAVRLPLGGTRG